MSLRNFALEIGLAATLEEASAFSINCDGEKFVCNEAGHVREVNLSGLGLSGKLSFQSVFNSFPGVISLNFSHNNLIGSPLYGRPPGVLVGVSSDVHTLDLSHNDFSGSWPEQLWTALPQLRVLDMSYNRMDGQLPFTLSAFFRLESCTLAPWKAGFRPIRIECPPRLDNGLQNACEKQLPVADQCQGTRKTTLAIAEVMPRSSINAAAHVGFGGLSAQTVGFVELLNYGTAAVRIPPFSYLTPLYPLTVPVQSQHRYEFIVTNSTKFVEDGGEVLVQPGARFLICVSTDSNINGGVQGCDAKFLFPLFDTQLQASFFLSGLSRVSLMFHLGNPEVPIDQSPYFYQTIDLLNLTSKNYVRRSWQLLNDDHDHLDSTSSTQREWCLTDQPFYTRGDYMLHGTPHQASGPCWPPSIVHSTEIPPGYVQSETSFAADQLTQSDSNSPLPVVAIVAGGAAAGLVALFTAFAVFIVMLRRRRRLQKQIQHRRGSLTPGRRRRGSTASGPVSGSTSQSGPGRHLSRQTSLARMAPRNARPQPNATVYNQSNVRAPLTQGYISNANDKDGGYAIGGDFF